MVSQKIFILFYFATFDICHRLRREKNSLYDLLEGLTDHNSVHPEVIYENAYSGTSALTSILSLSSGRIPAKTDSHLRGFIYVHMA